MRAWDGRSGRVSWKRRGAVVALVALLMPVMVGMLAVGVDFAVVTTARAQMQTACDAAALAGAKSLANEERLRSTVSMVTQIAAAQGNALLLATANRVLGSSPVLKFQTGTAEGADVVVGYLHPDDTTSTRPDPTAPPTWYNSVQVIGRRDPAHGGLVPGFFSGFFGSPGFSIQLSATATAHPYSIKGFRPTGSARARILPIVMQRTTYLGMITGLTGDMYSYNTYTGTVTSGSDGVKESVVYPVQAGLAGNWGTINFGTNNNSTSTLGDQIRNGVTEAQMKAEFPATGTLSLDQFSDGIYFHTFRGDPGISAGIKDDLMSIIGKPVTIPLYDLSGGNGNNAWYRVVDFAVVRIVAVNFKGNPKYVIVQPALTTDPTAIPGDPQPGGWSQGGLVRLFLSR